MKKLKLLWILQLSSVRDGLYYPLSDSSYNFAKNIILGIMKVTKDLDIILAMPDESKIAKDDMIIINDFLRSINVKKINISRTTSVFGTRYDFNYDEAKEILLTHKPNFIFEFNPTHVRGWKTILKELDIDIELLTYFNWIDSPLYPKVDKDISYWWRQFDGILSADKVFFNSYYSIEQIVESCLNTINIRYFDENIIKKMYKMPPSYDNSIFKYANKNKDSNGIIYNHRLSSLDYYKDAYETFLTMLSRFESENGFIPDVYFTNPSRKQIPQIDFINNKDELHFVELNEEDYYNLLGSDKVGIAPNCFINSKGMWSIATVEAALTYNSVILPKKFGYAEMAKYDYEGFYHNFGEAYSLFSRLIYDKHFRNKLNEQFIDYAKSYENVVVAKDFLNVIGV